MTLRRFATSECMEPSRDLDKYGQYLFSGNLTLVQIDFQRRVASYANKSPEEAKKAAADALYAMHWGPTRVTLYNLLLLATFIDPMGREGILQVTRWLANEAQVPVNGRDVSGTTAMHHAISTKPSFDPEFAQILYDAGGDVMIRNRYGETAVFEAVKVMDPDDAEQVERASGAIEFYLTHGGNMDIKDNDGAGARDVLEKIFRLYWKSEIGRAHV